MKCLGSMHEELDWRTIAAMGYRLNSLIFLFLVSACLGVYVIHTRSGSSFFAKASARLASSTHW